MYHELSLDITPPHDRLVWTSSAIRSLAPNYSTNARSESDASDEGLIVARGCVDATQEELRSGSAKTSLAEFGCRVRISVS